MDRMAPSLARSSEQLTLRPCYPTNLGLAAQQKFITDHPHALSCGDQECLEEETRDIVRPVPLPASSRSSNPADLTTGGPDEETLQLFMTGTLGCLKGKTL